MNRNASWSDMYLFNNFKILVGILFGPSLLSWFKEEIKLETPELSVGVIKNDSICKGLMEGLVIVILSVIAVAIIWIELFKGTLIQI